MPRVTITVPEKTAQPYRFQLDRQVVTLGRGSENDIAIDCGSVSVKHAEMRRVEGGYELRDLGSTNGIKLDNERFQAIPLRNGMSVKLGDVAFDFLLADEELEALAQEQLNRGAPVLYEPEKILPMLPPLGEREDVHHPHLSLRDLPELKDNSMGGYAMLLVFILAVAAFCGGMAVRFKKETGGSLINAIQVKLQTVSVPAKTVPAAPETVPDDARPGTASDTVTPGQ